MAWLVGFPRKAARAHCAIVLEHSRSLCTAGEHIPAKLGNQPCIFILKIEQSEAQRCDRKLGPVDVRELVRAFLARGEAALQEALRVPVRIASLVVVVPHWHRARVAGAGRRQDTDIRYRRCPDLRHVQTQRPLPGGLWLRTVQRSGLMTPTSPNSRRNASALATRACPS